jgi:hypothetical protein
MDLSYWSETIHPKEFDKDKRILEATSRDPVEFEDAFSPQKPFSSRRS